MRYYLNNMVDNQRAVRGSVAKPIFIFPGCNARVASAVNMFSKRWGRYSAKSRRYQIYGLIADIVDGAWCDYVTSLPGDYPGSVLCGKTFLLSLFAEQKGFRCLDDQLLSIMRYVELRRGDINPDQIHIEFGATVSTLREFASRCGAKMPKNARRPSPHCELCGDATELTSVRRGADSPTEDRNEKATLSGRYCSKHRPKLHDGTWNLAYRRARRSKEEFDRQIYQIEHHTSDVSDPSIAQRKGLWDPYLWDVARKSDLFLLDDERIRNVVRELVDSKANDRKRQVFMLLDSGAKKAEIARQLGVSRQAISKMVSSKSFKRTAEMYRSGV
jgi:hypothetical protein